MIQVLHDVNIEVQGKEISNCWECPFIIKGKLLSGCRYLIEEYNCFYDTPDKELYGEYIGGIRSDCPFIPKEEDENPGWIEFESGKFIWDELSANP